MGRTSNRNRRGKSKKGGKQQQQQQSPGRVGTRSRSKITSRSSNRLIYYLAVFLRVLLKAISLFFGAAAVKVVTAFFLVILAFILDVYFFLRGTNTAEKFLIDTMQSYGESIKLIRRGNGMEKALKLKVERDEYEEKLRSLSPKDFEEVDENTLGLVNLLMATMTLTMAQCGLVEEEKHCSIVYVEEHADKLFASGGEAFFEQWKDATDKAELEQKKINETEKMINDGDTDTQMLILQDLIRTVDKIRNDRRIELGLPPLPENDNFHNTILDDELFHPCPPGPDCPICFLPLPERNECCYQPCCGKTLCDGCIFAHRDAKDDLGEEYSCPFCRDSIANTDMARLEKTGERLKHSDSEAFYMLGAHYFEGRSPFKQNLKKAEKLLNQAAELGSEAAHHALGVAYANGVGGMEKNEKKALYHLRLAAIGGMLESRYFLGQAYLRGDPKFAYKHFLIAAEAGHDGSLKKVKTGYAKGHVKKDVFENARRAHKAAKEELKSEAREKAAEWYRRQSIVM